MIPRTFERFLFPVGPIQIFVIALLMGGLRDPGLAALGAIAAAALLWRERPALGPARWWLPWLGWAAISAVLSASPLAALPVLARWGAALGLFSLAAAWSDAEREKWLKTLLIVAAALSAAAFATGAWANFHFRDAMTGLIPPYYNYTMFVVTAATAAGAAWVLHPKGPKGRERALAIAGCALGLVCIAFAQSRGAMMALTGGAAVWALRRWGFRAAGTIAAGAAIVAAALMISPQARDMAFKARRARGDARPLIWRAAALTASEKPFFGEGPGQFAAAFRRHPAAAPSAAARWAMGTEYAHNEYFQAAAETGWVGFALWAGAFVLTLGFLWGRQSASPHREAAAAAIASMAVQLFVDNMFQLLGLSFLFFSAAAVAGRPAGGRRWPRWAAVILGLTAVLGWLPRALAQGRPDRAAILYPTEVDALEDAAYDAALSGRWVQADAFWARAQALAPYNAIYPWRRAEIAYAMKDWASARALAQNSVAREPGFLRARLLSAKALAASGQAESARSEAAEIRRWLKFEPKGIVENGYERVVSGFDADDQAELERVGVPVKVASKAR